MAINEIDKIRAMIEEYRQFKIRFIQFSKSIEALIGEERLMEIEIKSVEDASMDLVVFDVPVRAVFSMIFDPDDRPIGRIDFIRQNEPGIGDAAENIYSLFFNKLGHILDSMTDSFSNRTLFDEPDIPHVLYRFLQKFQQALKIKDFS